MSRKRIESIELEVDVDGIEVPAALRPPTNGRASYIVRWKMHGKWNSASTGTDVLHEAKRIGREIVRGLRDPKTKVAGILTVEHFVEVQRKHYAAKAFARKAEKCWQKFQSVWGSFLRRFPIKAVQEVDAQMALDYISKLGTARRDVNCKYKTETEKVISRNTVLSHVSVLRAAWNRVRIGNRKAKAGIPHGNMVKNNPWEEISNNLPEPTKKPVVQFNPEDGQFEKLLDEFADREIAQLFLIISLWGAGRIEEVSMIQWDWVDDEGYIEIPDEIAKKGHGRVFRIPPSILARLQAVRVRSNAFVFAGFPAELRKHYRKKQSTERHADKLMDFSPKRLRWRMQKHIRQATLLMGLAGFSHHAIRRTSMELSDEGELTDAENRSAEKLGTTPENKRANYLQRKITRTHYKKAAGLYQNLTAVLREFPKLAERVGVEAVDPKLTQETDALLAGLSPEQRQELLLALLRSTLGKDGVA